MLTPDPSVIRYCLIWPAGSYRGGEDPERAYFVNFRYGLIFLLTRYDFPSTMSKIRGELNQSN